MNRNIQALVSLVVVSFVLSAISIPLVSAAEDFWETMEPMPTARERLGVAVVAGKIYAIGGYNGSYLSNNEIYDPATDTWTTKAPMPTARRDFGIAVYLNKIYVIGGRLSTKGVTGLNQVYDPLTDTWENRTPMPTPRSGLCANVVNGKIYLIGGDQDYPTGYPVYGPSFKNEVYDPETDTWTTKLSLPDAVYRATSAVVNNKIYILGGKYGPFASGYGTFNQVYDPETDTWTVGEPVPSGFHSAAAGATTGVLAPKHIYILGGVVGSSYEACNLTQVYDPENDTWTTGTPMPTPRWALGVAVVNDELYAIGGYNGETRLSVNEKYTPLGYIPEFPSWFILPLFLVASLIAIIIRKRVPHPESQ
jgi:N-acetylneuraminic acid mutarotase